MNYNNSLALGKRHMFPRLVNVKKRKEKQSHHYWMTSSESTKMCSFLLTANIMLPLCKSQAYPIFLDRIRTSLSQKKLKKKSPLRVAFSVLFISKRWWWYCVSKILGTQILSHFITICTSVKWRLDYFFIK